MKVNLFRPTFLALALALASLWPMGAWAGPDTVTVTRTDTRQQTVVPFQKRLADKVLIACGVGEPALVYVAPGYLEITSPASMMTYRRPAPLHPRHITRPVETGEKPTATPAGATGPAPSPAANPAPSPAPVAPAPAPADPEPGLLPESGAGNPAGQSRTDEILSYFQRQRPAPRSNNGPSQPSAGPGPADAAEEPSFLQTPQAPEQPVLPPSRATYHVTP